MRALVVYESMWGNTERVGRAVARGLRRSPTDLVEVLDVSGDVPQDVAGLDLVVVGGPTHAFSMSRATTRRDAVQRGAPAGHDARGIREWLGGLPASGGVRLATFDTRVDQVRHLPGSAAKGAAKVVRRHRLGLLVGTESFFVADTEGPLLDGELDRAEAWGAELASAVPAVGTSGSPSSSEV